MSRGVQSIGPLPHAPGLRVSQGVTCEDYNRRLVKGGSVCAQLIWTCMGTADPLFFSVLKPVDNISFLKLS